MLARTWSYVSLWCTFKVHLVRLGDCFIRLSAAYSVRIDCADNDEATVCDSLELLYRPCSAAVG